MNKKIAHKARRDGKATFGRPVRRGQEICAELRQAVKKRPTTAGRLRDAATKGTSRGLARPV